MPGALMPFLLAAAAAGPTPAHGNLQGLFTGGDYPVIALRNDEEGRVKVRLGIDAAGFVEYCKVIVSSGSQSLDDQTCAVLRARAQFEPALDSKGRPVKDTYTQVINWRFAGDPTPPAPRQAWSYRSSVAFSKDGKIVDCKIETTGNAIGKGDCDAIVGIALSFPVTRANSRSAERYGFRRTAQTKADTLLISAANATSMAGSRTSIFEATPKPHCSLFVPYWQ